MFPTAEISLGKFSSGKNAFGECPVTAGCIPIKPRAKFRVAWESIAVKEK